MQALGGAVNLTWVAAVIMFIMAIIFAAWSIHHGVWQSSFFMLWGLLLWCLSVRPKAP